MALHWRSHKQEPRRIAPTGFRNCASPGNGGLSMSIARAAEAPGLGDVAAHVARIARPGAHRPASGCRYAPVGHDSLGRLPVSTQSTTAPSRSKLSKLFDPPPQWPMPATMYKRLEVGHAGALSFAARPEDRACPKRRTRGR